MKRLHFTCLVVFLLMPLTALAGGTRTLPHDSAGAAWSPYVVGGLIGVLSMLTFYFSDKPLSASTAYARLAGMLGKRLAPKHTAGLKFYQDKKPAIDWGVMLLFGVIIGAFLAARHGNELTFEWLPPLWAARFGNDSLLLRLGTAFFGAILMAFGARLAGGCTSGHGISGTLQLSLGSWISVICFFAGGIAVAMLMFRL